MEHFTTMIDGATYTVTEEDVHSLLRLMEQMHHWVQWLSIHTDFQTESEWSGKGTFVHCAPKAHVEILELETELQNDPIFNKFYKIDMATRTLKSMKHLQSKGTVNFGSYIKKVKDRLESLKR